MKNDNDVRIQIELPSSRVKELEDLMKEAGVATKKDLLNYALTILEWAIDEQKKGRVIGSLNEEGKTYKELWMPIFKNVNKRTMEKV